VSWCARPDKVIEDPIRHCFVECAHVAVRSQIELQRLAFNAEPVRHVINIDPGKIGLSCDRAERSKIVGLEMD